MLSRHRILAVLTAGLLSLSAGSALAQVSNTYDLTPVDGSTTASPLTLTGTDGSTTATFSSPSAPGAYTVGANNGLYTNFALTDLLALGGNDTISVTTNTGSVLTATASVVGSDLFPEGTITFSSASAFTSLVIAPPTAYTLTVADLTTSSSPTPEPESLALMGAGLLAVFAATRFRRR